MDLRALADFNLVATHRGLGRASRASGQPKATLSRRIAELEAALGVRLLERGARSVRLTEDGAALHARLGAPLGDIEETLKAIGAMSGRPHGRLRVSAPILFAHVALGRIAADFVAAHPDVQVLVTADDAFIDPVADGYDVVIRVNPGPVDDLVGRCFLHDEMLVVADPSISRPMPAQDDPAPVRAVVTNATPPDMIWRIDGDIGAGLRPMPVLILSSLLMVRDAVRAGAGAARLPKSMVGGDVEAGRLSCWGTLTDSPVSIWALHTSRRLVSTNVRLFLDALERAFPDKRLR